MKPRRIDRRVVEASTNPSTANDLTLLERILQDRNLPLLLNEKQLAELINISPSALRKIRSEGRRNGRSDLPAHVYHGRRVRYPIDNVIKWINSLNEREAQ